jgi:hypothetical protein
VRAGFGSLAPNTTIITQHLKNKNIMIYNEIFNFCKIRDENRKKYSNRAKYIIDLLDRLGIKHKVIRSFHNSYKKYFYDIFCFGSSDKFLSAHYDVVNIHADNANDDSASVINCIAYKLINPSVNIILLDGEEPPYMGAGSDMASNYLKKNGIQAKWIFNLELTGVGKRFFIDNVKTSLAEGIIKNFPDVLVTSTPFNDAVVFRSNGIISNVTTTFDLDDKGKPDLSHLWVSHGLGDSANKMKPEDMKSFVENVVDVIVKKC